jgi:hypothetical protein
MPALGIPQVTEVVVCYQLFRSERITISQDDLAAFHTHHFDGKQQGFPKTLLSATAPETTLVREEYFEDRDLEYDYEDDDGLGYYPDGVKRTLTDAQIAMFRWSEAQSLSRAKSRQLEDLEGGRLDEGSAESKENQQAKRNCSCDGSEVEESTQNLEKREERSAYNNINAERRGISILLRTGRRVS